MVATAWASCGAPRGVAGARAAEAHQLFTDNTVTAVEVLIDLAAGR